MQLTTIVAMALLPLLAMADEASTLTSTMTMTKYVTISKVSTSSVFAANTTSAYYLPTGSAYHTSSFTLPTTTSAGDSGSPTASSPAVSPTIDNGAGSLSAFAFAGVAGMAIAAIM